MPDRLKRVLIFAVILQVFQVIYEIYQGGTLASAFEPPILMSTAIGTAVYAMLLRLFENRRNRGE